MSQLTPFSVNTKIVNVSKDERGVVRADVTPEAQRWFSRLYEAVARIEEMQQKSLISSLDGLITPSLGDATWPAANFALFVPFTVYAQITIKRILIPFASPISGNVDVGIYRRDKTRIVSCGSVFAMMGGVVQAINITNTTLAPGRYLMGMAADNAAVSISRAAGTSTMNRLAGVQEEASSFPLPATAAWQEHASRQYIPHFSLDSQGGEGW